MAYGADQKPEAAVFTGKVSATQGQNNTQSDTMTYFLNTKRLQATGHVRSKVIQSNNSNSTASKSNTVTAPANEGKVEPIVNGGIAANTTNSTSAVAPAITNTGAPVIIVSDTQDYNKETGRLDAVGNCKIFYEDTVGIGPKIVMVRNAYGQAEKVVFIGRSQITQPGKRWIGDRITMFINDRRVLAEGNTRAFILQKKMEAPVAPPQAVPFESAPDFKLADKSRPTTSDPDSSNSDSSGKLSTTKVDRPE
jgi:lipopolysaccharide export system protein LptA